MLSQFSKGLHEPGINRKGLEGRLGLGTTHSAVDNASLDHDVETFPIEITPLQSHDFTHPQTKTDRNQSHGVVGLGQLFQQEPDLFRRQHTGYAPAPAALAYQIDRIGIDQLPSPRALIEEMKHASNMDLAFRCQMERPQPLFNRHWLHFFQ